MKTVIMALGLVGMLAGTNALAGDAAAGAQKAVICGACHGVDGNSFNPEWPNLAGQHAEYTAAQLALFKQMVRNNPVMYPNALMLSDEDMADLGAYFEAQTVKGLEADPSSYALGEKLYRGGDASRGLPACIACHGPQGKGNGPAQYPALRAQHSVYTYNQLRAYASGERKVAGNAMMQAIAPKLTDDEMRALASYVQGLR